MSLHATDRAALEARATIILARAAMNAGALDPSDFDFIEGSPARAPEVTEYEDWLAYGGAWKKAARGRVIAGREPKVDPARSWASRWAEVAA